jgi:hypothetical protein
MVRSSTQHNKSGQSSLKSSEINISERQKKTSIKGTVGEYEAIAKLTKEGYFVAKAVDPSCPFDIVLVDKKGKSLKHKPKKSCLIYRCPTKEQKKLGIKLMMVDYES